VVARSLTDSQPPVIQPNGSGTAHWFKVGNFLVTAIIRDDKVVFISYEHYSGEDIGLTECDYLSAKNLPDGAHWERNDLPSSASIDGKRILYRTYLNHALIFFTKEQMDLFPQLTFSP
jgi:hypothetical protein